MDSENDILNIENIPEPMILSKETNKFENFDRRWSLIRSSEKIIFNNIQILMKTRNSLLKETCDERLFSSIKYEIYQTLETDFDIPFFFGNICVCDFETGQKLYDLKGQSDITLKKTRNGKFEGKNR
jgi:hypothetical protein